MSRLLFGYCTVCCFLVGICHPGFSQRPISPTDFQVAEILTESDGLPGPTVDAMASDPYGFVWMAGVNGLVKYDGNTLSGINLPDKLLPLRDIHSLEADSSYLWLGVSGALFRLDLATEKLDSVSIRFQEQSDVSDEEGPILIHILFKDRVGRIWIGTRHHGCAWYNGKTGLFVRVPIRSSDIPGFVSDPRLMHNVLGFCADANNPDWIWVGTQGCLVHLQGSSGRYRLHCFEMQGAADQESQNAFLNLHQGVDGRVYSASWHEILRYFDPATEKLVHLSADMARDHGIQLSLIEHLESSSDQKLWITTSTGLYAYDPALNTVTTIGTNDPFEGRFSGLHYVDSWGRKYGFRSDGITIYHPRDQLFQLHSFKSLYPDASGMCLDATWLKSSSAYLISVINARGLYLFYPDLHKWECVTVPVHLTPGEQGLQIRNVCPVDEQSYLVVTPKNLLLFDSGQKKFARLPIDLPLENARIYNAYHDSRGRVWIATSNAGVFRWDRKTNQLESISFPDDPGFGAGTGETFFEDRSGQMWIKCREAFAVMDPVTDRIRHFVPDSLLTPYYATFNQDSQGDIWVTCHMGWIGRVDLDAPGYLAETIVIGEADDHIKSCQMDADGILWCALGKGLVRFDPQTRKFRRFPYADQLRAMPLFSMYWMPDDRLVFTSKDNIFIARTKDFDQSFQSPQPYVSAIDIRNQPWSGEVATNYLKALELKPGENFFTFSFSALGHKLDRNVRFRYRLYDFQEEWTEAADHRRASFTNVPSGQYQFELQLVTSDVAEPVSTYVLPVFIRQKWHERFWVRALGVLFVIGFFHSVYRYRIQQIRREEKLKTEFELAVGQAEVKALRAQMNPHFIFNSLNSIENYILRHDAEKAVTYLNDFARLIRLILENSRTRLIPLTTELEMLELYLEMESLRFSGKFSYGLQVDSSVNTAGTEIPSMLIQPFVENAIWHGIMPRGEGHVQIDITRNESDLKISVTDNGIGRARAAEINIRKGQQDKSSLGMTITRERIAMLNKLYKVDSRIQITDLFEVGGDPSGTRVEITMPLAVVSHPDA